MKKLVSRLEGVTEGLMAIDLTIMVGLVFSNAVARYGFGSGFAGAEELARLLFVWMIFLGAILALRRRGHLGVELVQQRLPRPVRRASAIISHLLILYALWLFMYGSWKQTVIGMSTYSTVLHYPNAIMASAGLVCAVAMSLTILSNLFAILANDPRAAIPGEEAAVSNAHGEVSK